MFSLSRKGVSPVIAIVLLLMMTVAAAGAAYFWLTQMQSGIQKRSTKSIENIMQKSGRRLISQAAICEPTAPEGMVAWYEFYEGGGNKTYDSSKNENIGTIYGASWTDGKAGKALGFYGYNDYVEISGVVGLVPRTISAWIYADGGNDGSYRAILKGPTANKWCGLQISDSNNLRILYSNTAGSLSFCGFDVSTYYNEWIHVVGLIRDDGTIELWRNGEKVSTDSLGGTIEAWSDPPGISDDGQTFSGKIDEARIYDRALSAEEINETYKGKMKVRVTVRNVGSVEVPEAKFVANLKKDGTTVDSDTYTTTSSIDTGDLKTLTFYFNEMRPGGEGYTISIPGIGVSQTVKCQSLE